MNGPEPRADQAHGDIQAVIRASQILGLFRPASPVLTVAEAATALGLNRSTTHRYFTSLRSAGLLARSGEGSSFVPGELLVQLGAFALGRRAAVDLAPPHLVSLARETRLTAALSLWGATGPVVARVEEDTTSPVVVTVRIGHQLPVDSAQGKVFLAFLPDRTRAARLLSSVPTADRRRLLQEAEQARRTAVASTHLVESDLTAVGAPVFDTAGICATMAVIGTGRTLPVDVPGPAWGALTTAARRLSRELGGEDRFPPDVAGLP